PDARVSRVGTAALSVRRTGLGRARIDNGLLDLLIRSAMRATVLTAPHSGCVAAAREVPMRMKKLAVLTMLTLVLGAALTGAVWASSAWRTFGNGTYRVGKDIRA